MEPSFFNNSNNNSLTFSSNTMCTTSQRNITYSPMQQQIHEGVFTILTPICPQVFHTMLSDRYRNHYWHYRWHTPSPRQCTKTDLRMTQKRKQDELSINDPHLIIVSRDPPMAWPLLNSCGSLFFSWIIFVHKKIISLSAEACPGNTSWIFILCKLREIQYTVVPRRERERGENGRYQNHFLDIKI